MGRKLISIISPTFNEEDNVDELYKKIVSAIDPLSNKYDFEILIIDNNSSDNTVEKLRAIAKHDKRLKVIVNMRNFGHIRSPLHAFMQSSGDATIYLASDLQDPPEMLPEFISHWEKGFKLVMAIKPKSEGNRVINLLRRAYYKLLESSTDVPIVKDATGFGLYDREILRHIAEINDPYPYFRGLVSELGYPIKTIVFDQPKRVRGVSKNNFYTLYDIAWLGFVGHSKVPIRISAFIGFLLGLISIITAGLFIIIKLLFWNYIPIGIAPIIIGMFFFFGMQFIFIGILGEYVGAILTYLQKRPVVIEKERINFENKKIDADLN